MIRMPPPAARESSVLSFPFLGADWDQKWTLLVLALALLNFLVPPLASMLSMGVGGCIAQPVIREGRAPSLPERLDVRALLRMGLRWWLVSSLFQLPALILVAVVGVGLLGRYGLPRIGEPWPGAPEAWPTVFITLAVALPLALLSAWFSNVAQMHVTARGSLRAAFRVGEWGGMLRANLRGFLAALVRMLLLALGIGAAQFVLSLPAALLIVAPAILAAFFGLYLRCVSAALYAQAYRIGAAKVGEFPQSNI